MLGSPVGSFGLPSPLHALQGFPAGAAAAAAAAHEYLRLKKARLANGTDFPTYENGHLQEKSPLLANGYNQPPTHLSAMQLLSAGFNPHPGAHHGSPADVRSVMMSSSGAAGFPVSVSSQHLAAAAAAAAVARPYHPFGSLKAGFLAGSRDPIMLRSDPANGVNSPVLNLSKKGGESASDGDGEQEEEEEEEDEDYSETEFEEHKGLPTGGAGKSGETGGITPEQLYSSFLGSVHQLSSTETLLRNIEGLLRVAAESARQTDRQVQLEKAELKMELAREREQREGSERQLNEEQRIRGLHEISHDSAGRGDNRRLGKRFGAVKRKRPDEYHVNRRETTMMMMQATFSRGKTIRFVIDPPTPAFLSLVDGISSGEKRDDSRVWPKDLDLSRSFLDHRSASSFTPSSYEEVRSNMGSSNSVAVTQRRLRKEKRLRRRAQENLEGELRRRRHLEELLTTSAPPELLRKIQDVLKWDGGKVEEGGEGGSEGAEHPPKSPTSPPVKTEGNRQNYYQNSLLFMNST
ncbi:unnamed protein product [Darwinula stevensoni]|uniref:Uncharacterized protein n=1 Tax=Darwinula stevensoni TaxID=69355 RepID=A0A7R9A7Q2_9CRUS|nr:unnamed protein product [Darwinula stevensoni]CAG0892982.1 unnamed protein product [Darwinula stevensoni]